MKKVIIYAGTTEGRRLAEILASRKIPCIVSVATEYGEQVLEENPYITIHQGRMSAEQMKEFTFSIQPAAVVDATHPFATEVSKAIRESVKDTEICTLRLLRRTDDYEMQEKENIFFVKSAKDCVKELLKTEGNILLTTGSKELSVFAGEEALKKRLYVRVLPGLESFKLCCEAGLRGSQIIAMQGPFTTRMNLATIEQYKIAGLVTKESGKVGGVDSKLEAARAAGIPVWMIENPEKPEGLSLEEVLAELSTRIPELKEWECIATLKKEKPTVSLVGLGMGSKGSLTLDGQRAIEEADFIFGAPRLLEGIEKKEKEPFYLAKDILPRLEELWHGEKVCVVFSGDTGFYSGAGKLYETLVEKEYRVEILPGISTVSMLAAKTAVNWQDAALISLHGKDADTWKRDLSKALLGQDKIFGLTSGLEQLKEVGTFLEQKRLTDCKLWVGYQLSYPTEWVKALSLTEVMELAEEGLYSFVLLHSSAQFVPQIASRTEGNAVPREETPRKETPCEEPVMGRKDEVFIRGKVPMTKEEVREISIGKLQLCKNSIVYDIGSGTGSIAVECAGLSSDIRVYAVEQKEEALELIKQNKEKFRLWNIEPVYGTAPEALKALPAPTHAFIGGSKGKLIEILECLYQKNQQIRVVINAISLETIAQLSDLKGAFEYTDFEVVTVQTARSKTVGNYHLMQGENPVMICSLRFVPEGENKDLKKE